MRYISLGILLFAFWLALSGHYTTLLLTIGVIATLLCLLVARAVGTADEEGHPIQLFASAFTYFPWLMWEIVKAAWGTAKVIIDPRLPISPTMTIVTGSQKTPVGLATYANSITLTPGTITTHVKGNQLTVHALVADGATDLEGGGMDKRVTQFEGGA